MGPMIRRLTPTALAALVGLALAATAAPSRAQAPVAPPRPGLPALGLPGDPAGSLGTDLQRRRRHSPGGAASPFTTLPDSALPFVPQTGAAPALMPSIPFQPSLPPQFSDRTMVVLDARFGPGGQHIQHGLHWRIFSDQPEASGAFALVEESRDAAPVLGLRPGGYILHVAYGTIQQARRIRIADTPYRETLILNAGAVRLAGKVGDRTIRPQSLSFDIYAGGLFDGGEPRLVRRQVPAGDLIALPEGTYHVVSTYGDANATIRADIRIRAGQMTDATIHHRAAQIRLSLVRGREGGERIDTAAWTVLTPGGDVIKESIGAFPDMVLQEGEYLAIARHEGRVFNKRFQVEAGKDAEIEVVAQ